MLVYRTFLLVFLIAPALRADKTKADGATDLPVLKKSKPSNPNIWLHSGTSVLTAQINVGMVFFCCHVRLYLDGEIAT
ncbi:hypothetical protein L596_012750 [Steinernema carpocapsae]|uniref:Uncharacterized protein n=1 Tax=Steinernema carpocapsae TaxID=34508 RepID=A0A4U5NYC2_STECR|nr:hypothetical protein L596_012750 [Steinernema carpocapsae]